MNTKPFHDAKGKPILVGQRVRVVRPDPDYGMACILAGLPYDHEVTEVGPTHVYLKPHPDIPLMPGGTLPFDAEELEVVNG